MRPQLTFDGVAREKQGRSFREMGPHGKGGEMFSEASGIEELEHLMTRGMRVTKWKMTKCYIFVFMEMSKHKFC